MVVLMMLALQVSSYAAHDLPVTGLGFASPLLAHTLGKVRRPLLPVLYIYSSTLRFSTLFSTVCAGMQAVVTSCSADRKFCVMKIGGTSNSNSWHLRFVES